MRLRDALDCFVVQLHADGRSQHTIDQYRRHVGVLARWLARVGHGDDVDSLTHEMLAAFLCSSDARTSHRGGAKKATSMNALRSSMRAFFSYVHAAAWSPENPARLIRRARCSGPPPRGLSDQDRERLLATLAATPGPVARRDHMLFHLMLATGIRLSSALVLTAADVDLERGEIELRAAKGQRVERVILGMRIREHLASYLAACERLGLLFPARPGQAMSRRHAARRLGIWMARAACKGTANPHLLRHDFASRLYRRTGDVLLVQAALGHRSLMSTAIYARTDRSQLLEVLAG